MTRPSAVAAGQLRGAAGDEEALDELDHAVDDVTRMLRCYETVLAEHGMRLPYFGHEIA
jgi:hypothetical protein